MKYKIVASGFNGECLTWADDTNLDIVKEHLKREGYVDIKITENKQLQDVVE